MKERATTTANVARVVFPVAGWPVFPCNPKYDDEENYKKPLTPHGFYDATTNQNKIGRWWKKWGDALIGMRTGRESGVFVVDVDVKKGQPGKESLANLENEHGALPRTLEVTTPSGGRHLYFRMPADGLEVRCSTSKIAPGIDIRGDGGYIIAPPSGVNGHRYEWADGRARTALDLLNEVAEAPAWLLDLVTERDGPERLCEPPGEVNELTLCDLESALEFLSADGYHDWIGMGLALKTLGDAGLDDAGLELWLKWSATSPKYNEAEARRKWDTFRPTNTDYRAVFTKARRYGWVNPAATVRSTPQEDFDPKAHPLPPPDTTLLRPVDLSGLGQAEIDEGKYVLTPYIPCGEVTLFSGHGGSGKSSVALSWSAHVAAGRDWGPLTAAPGPVLYLSFEDPAVRVLSRLRRICEVHNLPLAAVLANLRVFDATEAPPLAEEQVQHGVRRLCLTKAMDELAEVAADTALVVIDNASDAYDGDEISRRHVRKFLRHLAGLVRPHGGAVLLLGHIDKTAARYGAAGNTYSGSTAWHNSARSRVALVDDALHHEKLNLGKRRADPIPLVWSEFGIPLPDAGGFVRADEDAERDATDDEAVLKALQAAVAKGERVSTSWTGPATAWHTLSLYGLPDELRDKKKKGKERVDASLLRLQDRGEIHRESVKDRQRRDRKIWLPGGADAAPF